MNFGETIKMARMSNGDTLHQVSMGTDIDVTLLSKYERSQRFPHDGQVKQLAKYLKISYDDLAALVISTKIIKTYGANHVTDKAVDLVKEQLSSYSTRRKEFN